MPVMHLLFWHPRVLMNRFQMLQQPNMLLCQQHMSPRILASRTQPQPRSCARKRRSCARKRGLLRGHGEQLKKLLLTCILPKQMHQPQHQLQQQSQQCLRATQTTQAAAKGPKMQVLRQKAQQQLGQSHKLLMM